MKFKGPKLTRPQTLPSEDTRTIDCATQIPGGERSWGRQRVPAHWASASEPSWAWPHALYVEPPGHTHRSQWETQSPSNLKQLITHRWHIIHQRIQTLTRNSQYTGYSTETPMNNFRNLQRWPKFTQNRNHAVHISTRICMHRMILRWRVEWGGEEAELEGAGSSFISTSWVMSTRLYQNRHTKLKSQRRLMTGKEKLKWSRVKIPTNRPWNGLELGFRLLL